MEPRPILICYDGSADADRAIEAAADLFGGRHAVVLAVAPRVTLAESVVAPAVTDRNAFADLNEAAALDLARAGTERARGAGLDAESRTALASSTWEGIVDVADDLDAAVVVIGSRGLTAFRELTRGSVSHDVATHARRPVLIVPPPASH